MKEKFMKFIEGRYGVDSLNRFLSFIIIILLIVSIITRKSILSSIALVLLVISYFRIFSKNISKRYEENQKFLESTKPLRDKWNSFNRKFKDRKVYKYVKCPNCNLEMRVPKNKGKIKITCKNCKEKFEYRT